MGLFKSKYEKKLDDIITRMQMNMSNNYKDNAQCNLKELEEVLADYKSEGRLNEKTAFKYEKILDDYRERLKGYTHKDQKPFWT